MVVPILSILPLSQIQDWVSWTARMGGTQKFEERWFQQLEQDILDTLYKFPHDHVIITGHSLGGGIAQSVANRIGIEAVVFSSPGIIYSATRFNLSLETAERGTVVVMPDSDMVSRIDLQAGAVQRVACREKNGEAAQAAK